MLAILHKLRTPLRLVLCGILIFVVCLLPTVHTLAATSPDSKNWNLYCITAGDCALYDPTSCSVVNDTLNGTTTPTSVGSIIPDDQIPGASRKEKEWNYLISLGLTPVQVAGIMGNIANEGVFDPESVENIPGLPARSKNPYDAGQYGWGLFGFTPGYYVFGKTPDSYWYASNKAANIQPTMDNIYYISTQMDIEYAYMQYNKGASGNSLLDEYKARATSPAAAAAAWMELAEKPLHPNYGPRQASAIKLMNKFGKNGTSVVDTSKTDPSGAGTCCNTSSDPAMADLPVTGDTQVLAKQILNNPNITFDNGPDGNVAENFKRMAQDEEAQTDAGRSVEVQPIILVALLYLAKDHKVQVSSLTDGPSHLAKDNPHGMGDAMDIDFFDGQGTNGSDAVAKKIIDILEQVLPSGSRFGMGNGPFSGTQTVDGKDFTAFADNPNHVHFDVVGVSQEDDDKAVQTAGQGASAISSTESSSSQCCADGSSAGGDSAAADAALTGNTNAEKAFNYFIGKGLSAQAAAGIVGNMMAESAGNTENLDTHAHNDISGTHDGIVQWSTSRWNALKSHESGKDVYALSTQLDYVWYELTKGSYGAVLGEIKNASSAAEAATAFNLNYEVSGDDSGNREANARRIFAKYGGNAATGAAAAGGCAATASSTNGKAFVLGDYAWPVDIKKSEVDSGYPWPCPGNCHHDNTPAFDLSTKKAVAGDDADVVGRDEFAITDGTIDNLHVYMGISGCYSFHIKSSTDGYDYYYTHTRNPVVKEGQKVKVGDKVSEVGERKCTGNGSYPHLHIDRGSPKGSPGGSECCRDPGLVPIINKLYANLP
jgi:hypothetical protein